MKWFFYLFAFLTIQSINGQGLITTSDYIRDYTRLIEIQGQDINNPIIFNSNQTEIWTYNNLNNDSLGVWNEQLTNYSQNDKGGLNLYVLSPRIDYSYNSKYARSYNDGPLWSGRGSTIGINAGFKVKWGPVTGVLYPNFYHAQNKLYKTQSGLQPNQSPFNYQLSGDIDWVQLFGLDPLNEFDFGQSNIAVNIGHVQAKLSSENIWLGPSVLNPILMSNTAPGFPHVNIGTNKPIQTKYGDFELNSIWGQLHESDFFENIPSESKRYIVGLFFGYRPTFSDFMKGFSVGMGRLLQKNWPGDGLSFSDIFLSLGNTDPSASMNTSGGFVNDDSDQYLSFDARWYFEKSSAEFYFEWVRNDFWADFKDLVQEPEHGGVFSIGFQKAFNINQKLWRLGFEHTSLATTRTREARPSGDVYTHALIRQGYTHKGNLLGAPIGPGSKSQLLRLDRFDSKGKYGLSINRIRFNDNFYWNRFGNGFSSGDFRRHDVEWNIGLEAVRFFNKYEFSGKLIYSRRMNMHFYGDLDFNNFQLLTSVKWHLTNKPLLTLFKKIK